MARKTTQSRSLKPSPITIIGEGLTEMFYFKHLRFLYNYHYTLKPYFFGVTSLKEMDSKISEVIECCGIAVCVFDADVSERNATEKRKLEQLYRKYGNKVNVIFCESLPSIEYWFLIHYCETNKYFLNYKSVEQELRKFIIQYEKSGNFLENEKWVADLCKDGKLELAHERAQFFSNKEGSYSNIYKIFELLKSRQ